MEHCYAYVLLLIHYYPTHQFNANDLHVHWLTKNTVTQFTDYTVLSQLHPPPILSVYSS